MNKCDRCEMPVGKTYFFDGEDICSDCLKIRAKDRPTDTCYQCAETFLVRDLTYECILKGSVVCCEVCHRGHEEDHAANEYRKQLRRPSNSQALNAFDIINEMKKCDHLSDCSCLAVRELCEKVYAQEMIHWQVLERFDAECERAEGQ
jgi:hypothetical protein